MGRALLIYLGAAALLAATVTTAQASLDFRFLARRQAGEAEQEGTTPKSAPDASQQQPPKAPADPTAAGSPQRRLYPDLPGHAPGVNFLPPFNAPLQQNGAPPPFIPYNMPNRLNSDQQAGPFGPRVLAPPPRPLTPAERLQSQSFTNGLGKRLLSMVGIAPGAPNETSAEQQSPFGRSANMQALQNATVLNEVNRRLNMLMGSLSKMYNSTVREQLGMLQQRFKSESANSTNPWVQRMAQQVPMFFEQMAARVSGAQEQMNRVLQNVVQMAQGNASSLSKAAQDASSPFFNSIDRFMNGNGGQSGDFVDQIGRSLGIGPAQNDLGARVRDFWQVQVQPQIGMVRNQMSKAWRDLTSSGAFAPNSARSRMQPTSNNSDSGNELVDSLLKEAESESAEYSLISPKQDSTPQGPSSQSRAADSQANSETPRLSPQMQSRLAAMQRDLNQLWQGLSSSLQNAVNNARGTLNPRPIFGPMVPSQNTQEASPEQNALNAKIQDLSKLQREADVVYETVQQQQREAQQRQSLGDRFMGFVNNVDLRGMNIGDYMNRFGTSLGNFWNTIPERWDNMMSQRANQENQARMREQMNSRASTSTSAPAPASENPMV